MASHRFSYLIEVDCTPPAYVWTGHGRLEYASKTYLGAGHILSVPDIKLLINGVAERLEFSFSGVSEESLRLAVEDRETVYLAPARIGRVTFDTDWQVTGIDWQWHGVADGITVASRPTDNGRERKVTIKLASADTKRSNPQIAFFSDADQRKRSPDDVFFSHVAKINRGVSRRFGG